MFSGKQFRPGSIKSIMFSVRNSSVLKCVFYSVFLFFLVCEGSRFLQREEEDFSGGLLL